MNDSRKEALAVLGDIWELSPDDIRLGQLFAHLGFLGEAHADRSLGYIDDDQLLAVMRGHRDELQARQADDAHAQLSPSAAANGR